MADAIARTRRAGKLKPLDQRLRFTCRDCGGRWCLKEDAEACCQTTRCNRKTDCSASSHYGDCRSMPYLLAPPVSNLSKVCTCQGGWVCPACANLLRDRDTPAARAALAQKVIAVVEAEEESRFGKGAHGISAALREMFQKEGVEVK